MNVTAHQENKEKNEETKTGIEKAGERRRHATDFTKAVCCPSAVVSRGSIAKKWFQGSARGYWDPREGQQPFRPNPNGFEGRTTTLRWLFIGVVHDFAATALRYLSRCLLLSLKTKDTASQVQ